MATSPSTDVTRSQRYNWKLIPARVGPTFSLQMPQMSFAVARYLPIQESIRAKILAILGPTSVATWRIAGYMAAGLRMWSLKRRLGAAGAQAEIAYVIATWTGRKYNAGLLASIRSIITGVIAP